MAYFRYIKYILLIALVLQGCAAKKKAAKKFEEVKLYNPTSNKIHTSSLVYHHKDKSSLLYLSFLTNEFLFNQANEAGEYRAKAKVVYELTETGEKKSGETSVDTFAVEMKLDKMKNKFLATVPVKTEFYKRYFVSIKTYDLNGEKSGQSFMYIDKSSDQTAQNYLLISAETGFPLFKNVLQSNEWFQIQAKNKDSILFIRFYHNKQPLPPPTFALTTSNPIELKPDSVWKVRYADTLLYYLPYEGKYLFQFDTSTYQGVTLYNYGTRFPKFTHPDDLIVALAYLTTSSDYKKLLSANNKKLALDDYWFDLTNNMEVAKELIRIYYNRAMFANYYFTSDREGWKTDRGMIYIIYGLPDKVKKTFAKEEWQYFEKEKVVTLSFTFNKRNNPFTDNDFELERMDAYDSQWRDAVDTWREGKVYIIE